MCIYSGRKGKGETFNGKMENPQKNNLLITFGFVGMNR
jgi:hypothetical protein